MLINLANSSKFQYIGINGFIVSFIGVLLLGIVIGSFLNVCIYRIPLKEDIAVEPSHCMKCGHRLKWYELIPLFSYIIQGGKCRSCKQHISIQYPLVELGNGLLWILILYIWGLQWVTIVYCVCTSIMIVISVIDERTKEINIFLNLSILLLGAIRVALDYTNWIYYIIGLFAISIPFLIIVLVSKERAMGLGDVYLMAGAGLLLGWKHVILATVLGCIIGSVVHILRMKISKKSKELAFGPYLCTGIYIAIVFGWPMINWYFSLFSKTNI